MDPRPRLLPHVPVSFPRHHASAMDPMRSVVVLDYDVDVGRHLPVTKNQEWAVFRCAGRKAYGRGEHDQVLLDGLTLLARVASPTLSLFIHVNDQALQSVQAELGAGEEPLFHMGYGGMHASGVVQLADERFIVLTVMFTLAHCGTRAYYLVYDHRGESLSMVPHLPPHSAHCHTLTPIPVHSGGKYGLVLMARVLHLKTVLEQRRRVFHDALCFWHQAFTAAGDMASLDVAPWLVKERRFRAQRNQEPSTFSADVAFSFKSQAFWVDLSQGVLHCDFRASGNRSHIDFGFTFLPPNCRVDITSDLEMEPMTQFRTMGRVGDSIKFISIDHTGDICDRMVTVWTLHLHRKRNWWTQDTVFSVRSIWEQEYFKEVGLPETEPKCPVLMPAGYLCLLLPNKRIKREDSADDYICVLDLRSKNVLLSARLHKYHTAQPTIVPSYFLDGLFPLEVTRCTLNQQGRLARGGFCDGSDSSGSLESLGIIEDYFQPLYFELAKDTYPWWVKHIVPQAPGCVVRVKRNRLPAKLSRGLSIVSC